MALNRKGKLKEKDNINNPSHYTKGAIRHGGKKY